MGLHQRLFTILGCEMSIALEINVDLSDCWAMS